RFGGYADQRFVLVLLSGLLVISASIGFFFRPNLLVSGLMVFAPTLLLSLAFCLVAFAFRSQPYVWAEPGMYGFFFLAPVMAGFALGVTGDADRFIETLLL